MPWSAEDYFAPDLSPGAVKDHWAIEPVDHVGSSGPGGDHASDTPLSDPPIEAIAAHPSWPVISGTRPPVQLAFGLADVGSPQQPLPFEPAPAEAPAASDWFADDGGMPVEAAPDHPAEVDLPGFDPSATVARSVSDVFDRPHAFRSDTRAGMLARETAIASPEGRARAARVFGDALDEQRWPKLFQSWMRLAPQVDCPRVLALAFDLREYWEDSPHLWLHRTAPNRPGTYSEGARTHFSWRRALAMAEAAPHRSAAMLLDDDLIDEWSELGAPCPGFWNFADYAELRATGDEAEAAVLAVLAYFGRERRGLRHQDGCAHLDFTRAGWTHGIEGCVETGARMQHQPHTFGEENVPALPDEDE